MRHAHAMGDLRADTEVESLGGGRYRATISPAWEIWGPMGGYVAAIALRAIGAESPHARPAAFSCHYLSVAGFAPVDIQVETRKVGRTVASLRVEVTQDDRPILDGTAWTVGDVEGLEHDETSAPDVPGPGALRSVHELMPDEEPRFAFWRNLESKPVEFVGTWPPPAPLPARWQAWLRFLPVVAIDDLWLDAARSVILVDLPGWPSAHRPHAWTDPPFYAPTLDLNVAFHLPSVGEDWLLCDGAAPLSTGGLAGWNARVWSPGGRLHASGGGQCLYRRLKAPPAG